VLNLGDRAPDFELQNDDGEMVKLSDLRGKKIILYFYPKALTKGWTDQAVGFRDEFERIEAANAAVVGVSPDPLDKLQKFRAKNDLPFTLLSDPDHAAADLYGVWGEKKMYGKTYMGIVRSHFIIDEQGRIADAQVKVSPKKSVERALAALPDV
jgi:peroxiredoxin Q/BCP